MCAAKATSRVVGLSEWGEQTRHHGLEANLRVATQEIFVVPEKPVVDIK